MTRENSLMAAPIINQEPEPATSYQSSFIFKIYLNSACICVQFSDCIQVMAAIVMSALIHGLL